MSLFHSKIYRALLFDEEVGALFSDDAEINAMLQVEGALAKVQGELGVIPQASALAINAAMAEIKIDPASLANATATAGVPVPELVAAIRRAMQSAEHAQYLHWGATSQDIMDTALVLRLRRVCNLVENRLRQLLHEFAIQAEKYTDLPMAARTRTQIATPTSFGAVMVSWGAPLLDHLDVLAQLKPRLLRVSLAGASGNATALGDRVAEQRAALASELGLGDSALPWHNNRTALVEFASLLTRINGSLAKFAEDHLLATQPEVAELLISAGGGSSTMPQKNNPVMSETIVSLFPLAKAMDGLMTQAVSHRQQRDGVAWSLEWHALPQICLAAAKSLTLAIKLAETLQPNTEKMLMNLEGENGFIYAEAISFKLAEIMPRPQAQKRIKELCGIALDQQRHLPELVAEQYPDIDWEEVTKPAAQMGDAVAQVQRFVAMVKSI